MTFTNGKPASPSDWQRYDTDPRFAYLEWLTMEARLLRLEMWPNCNPSDGFNPVNTFALSFHMPADGKNWRDMQPPSSRALAVMQAAGVEIPPTVEAAA